MGTSEVEPRSPSGDAQQGRPERRAADDAIAARSGHRSRDSWLNTGEHWGRASRHPLLVALLAAIAIVLSSPFMGQIRAALQSALPAGAFRIVVAAVLIGAVALAVATGVARVREHRALRFGALALALGIGLAYARAASTGNPSVDVVERFHFVEYGLLTMLFYRVWRRRSDLSTLAAPVLAAIVVATLDEWLQWFVPARVGEMRDVVLDTVAIGCGLLFALGIDPPAGVSLRLSPGTSRSAALLPMATLVICALFFDVVHLGREVRVVPATTFLSRFTEAGLDAASRDRALEWDREGPPIELRRLSREDQYLSEGIWHVQRRNEAAGAGDALTAWRENLILERFFGPVLDLPSYAAPAPSRWPPSQRAELEALAAGAAPTFKSQAEPYPLYTWDRRAYWSAIGAIGLVIAIVLQRTGRTGRRTVAPSGQPS